MRISDWADRLGIYPPKSKGPEDFWTICPCHSDTKPSLHVYVGKKTGQTVMKCFVCGAKGEDVCKALDMPLSEVMCDAYTGEKPESFRPAAPAKNEKSGPKPARPFRIGQAWHGYTITMVYEYQTADGKVVLRKARGEKNDETGARIDKTFSVQSLGTDGKWYYSGGIYNHLLYHLPDVTAAAKTGTPIIIAEGEKDVDNLRKLGFTATCGLYGGGKYTGKDEELVGKWNDDHSRCFDGAAEVIVIPDNDAAGEGIAQWICKHIRDRVKTLKLLRIADQCPELPEHGDFTDWAALLKRRDGIGKSALIAKLRTMIEETPEWAPGNILRFEPRNEQMQEAPAPGGGGDGGGGQQYESYYGQWNYCIKNGCLARVVKDGAQVLCSFVPEPKETISRDDGSEVITSYVIGGRAANGMGLADAIVEGEAELAIMRWPMRAWKFWGNIKPIRGAKEMILDAISCAGQQVSKHRSIYGHTGIREIDGKICYLYAGGAIGADDVSVELTAFPGRYTLADRGYSAEEAGAAELVLLESLPARIICPLMAQAYLAPLYSLMESMHIPPSYVVFLVGGSNSGKSTVAGYAQSHFGDYYEKCFPASFADSANGARDKSFWAKDALYTVDDYVPNRDGDRRSAQDMVANTVISAVADRAGRSTLGADKTLKSARPSRCTCIMTGEELPRLTTSRQLRLYRIDVEKGEIASDMRELAPLRSAQRDGLYQQCMREYIKGLIARWDELPGEIHRRMQAASDRVHMLTTRREGRLVDATTHLLVGVGLMLDHLMQCGALTEEGRAALSEKAETAICRNIEAQGKEIDEARPERVWLRTLASLIMSHSVTLVETSELTTEYTFKTGMIGFVDEDYYYIIPAAADEAIAERLRKGGETLGVNTATIRKELAKLGYVRCTMRDGAFVSATRNMRIGKRQGRMLWIYRWVLDGEKPADPEEAKNGFTPADGEQLPMEFNDRRGGNAHE